MNEPYLNDVVVITLSYGPTNIAFVGTVRSVLPPTMTDTHEVMLDVSNGSDNWIIAAADLRRLPSWHVTSFRGFTHKDVKMIGGRDFFWHLPFVVDKTTDKV